MTSAFLMKSTGLLEVQNYLAYVYTEKCTKNSKQAKNPIFLLLYYEFGSFLKQFSLHTYFDFISGVLTLVKPSIKTDMGWK